MLHGDDASKVGENEVWVNLKTKEWMNFGNLQVEHEGTTTRSQSLDSEEFEENNRWQQQQQQVKVELLYEMNAGPT